MDRKALIVGNSDGIGLGITKELLQQGWSVHGMSRSVSPITDATYTHHVVDVQSSEYIELLKSVIAEVKPLELCLYCAGIGEMLDLHDMTREEDIFMVNLVGLVRTVSVVVPLMVDQRCGHLIGLSSVADEMLSFDAPSYHASKAGFSNYLEGLVSSQLNNVG